MRQRLLFFIVLIMICVTSALSDELSFQYLSSAQGLKCTWAWNIMKDSRGYMWFSTTNGAYRYNGYDFEEYSFKHIGRYSRAKVYFVYEDSQKDLWFGTDDGLYRHNRNLNTYTRYSVDADSPIRLSSNLILCMLEDTDGTYWVGTNYGINKLDIEAGKNIMYQRLYTTDNIRSTSLIYTFFLDSSNRLWAGGGEGIAACYNRKNKAFDTLPHDKLPCNQRINKIYEDNEKNFWFATEGDGVFKLDSLQCTMTHFCEENKNLSNNIARAFASDADHALWIGTEKGITIIKDRRPEFVYVKSSLPNGLNDNAIYSIYTDEDKNVWVGTFFGGVNVHYTRTGLFHTVNVTKGDYSLQRSAISSIINVDGKILVGTENFGLFVLDESNNKVDVINTENSNLNSNNIHSLCVDNNQNLWIGTYYGGINISPKGASSYKHLRQHSQEAGSIQYNNVYCIIQDRKGTIWIGTQYGGLCVYNPTSGKVEQAPINLPNDIFVWDLMEDKQGNIWVASYSHGVFKLDVQNGYRVVPLTEQVYNNVNLYELSDGKIALGSETMGLTIIDPTDMSTRKYTENNGFPDNTVYAILQDAYSNIWLSTNKGLYKFDLQLSKFTNYTVSDGLPTNRFNYKAAANIDGKLYFGSTEGLVVVDPDMEKPDDAIHPIWLDNFYVHGEKQEVGSGKLLNQELNNIREIHLNHKQTSWGVDFTCNTFNLHSKPRFAYKFLGFDDQWQVLDSKHRLDFPAFSYGKYKLSICTVDNDGKPHNNQRILHVRISPPWWQSTLAKVLFALALAGITLYLFYLFTTNQKNKHALALEKVERKKDTEINELKLRFFVNISHEFKTPLSLILGPVNQFMENRVKPSKQLHYYSIIKKNADKLLNLINELLAFRELEHLKLKIEPINYLEFIHSVLSKHTLVFESKDIQFDVTDAGQNTIIHADADKLEKIFDNLLSNASKYTDPNGTLSIDIQCNTDEVVTIVTNTGAGIDKDKLPFIFDRFFTNDSYDKYSSGVGLSYVKSLVEVHGGTISADSQPGEYTRFTFSIPIRKDILQVKPRAITDYNLDVFSDNPALAATGAELPDLQFEAVTRNTQVLIVDDDNDLREIIADYLSDAFMITAVSSAEEALKLIEQQSVDIVVSDVKMKGMSGYELCQTLKGDINTSHIRVILMTVLSETSYRYSGYKSGADAYITKPFELSLLELRIRNLLYNSYEAKQKYKVDIDLSNVEVAHSNSDEELLNNAVNLVFKNLSDPEFGVEKFCTELNMSKASLYRKLRATTGQSINEFIQNIRLKYAARILIETDKNISEIAYEVGFSDPYYFSRAFKKCFAQSPQHWRDSKSS